MANKNNRIFVYADWQELLEPILVGSLMCNKLRGKEIFSFEYTSSWLQSDFGYNLDPDLQFFPGQQYVRDDKPNFGLFLDSSPDRWGRVLMRRREAIVARLENRKAETLYETDYLLGVYDENRMGALRFKTAEDGPFLSHEKKLAAPAWTKLRDLEYASLQLEKEGYGDDDEELKWLNMLMAPGSSLGGARPKASVTDLEGQLWIAKFPSTNDLYDVGAWEMVVHQLALEAGLNVPPAQLMKFSGRHHTFLTKRFDRKSSEWRIHFASAMTLLGHKDGADYHAGTSYLDLVSFILQNGYQINENLKELWRRIAFNVLVKNTDDHLRNHGFLLQKDGWILSPAYDMNAVPSGTGLTLNISDEDNSLDLDLVMEVAPYFRLSATEALQIMLHLKKTVGSWKTVAAHYKISNRELSLMAPAFHMQ
ncbi:HipA domain-containing protein [Pedobacter sp. MC2016-14]|uniref:type II toxin-antitoxin system HipA family toxin n=1 Tax=Pedobacter sp. MC2016-14 TaxID=2897327 RepID=UPI001E2C4023|nr:HipA domain-containing protein [Pedobacter sp. MC2016-14]MCD0490686.1 HipA domain-containing protein [Pedobacter sp. MC2016-14]